jgi:hypothetical protein
MFSLTAYSLIGAVQTAVDGAPEPADVVAGWTAFAIFLLMFAAVVGLGFSMAKQFKKAARSRDAGILPTVHDRNPVRDTSRDSTRNSTDA